MTKLGIAFHSFGDIDDAIRFHFFLCHLLRKSSTGTGNPIQPIKKNRNRCESRIGERTRPRVQWSAPSPTTGKAFDRRGRRSLHARARVLPGSRPRLLLKGYSHSNSHWICLKAPPRWGLRCRKLPKRSIRRWGVALQVAKIPALQRRGGAGRRSHAPTASSFARD
jgi:hypothetical protein